MRLHGVLGCALLLVIAGCSKDDKKPAAGPPAPAPAPAPAAPDAGAAPAPAPVAPAKSETQKALEAANAATPETQEAALTALRKAIESAPEAPEAGGAAKALATAALGRAAAAVQGGQEEVAKRFAGLVLDASGGLPAPIRTGLGPDADGALAVARAASEAGLDGLDEVAKLAAADGTWKEAAGQIVRVRLAPLVQAFAPAPLLGTRLAQVLALAPAGDFARCPEVRGKETAPEVGCDPAFYGLDDKAALPALAGAGLTVMRLATLARLAGDAAPKGTLHLPLPEAGAAAPKAVVAATARALPLETVVVNALGVHVTLRPVAALDGTALASGGLWPGALVFSTAQLTDADKDEALQPLVDAFGQLRSQAAAVEAVVFGDSPDTNSKREKGKWATLLIVEKATPTKLLAPVLRALDKAGYPDVRWVRSGAASDVLAAPVRTDAIPQDRWGRTEERPLIVHLRAESADVFEAHGKGEAPREEAAVSLPSQARRWYKGKSVFKLEVRGADVDPLVQTVRYLRREGASGTVVVVVPGPEVSAERTTEVAAALAAAAGPAPQTKLSAVFPGLVCKDEEPTIEAAACQTLFPIIAPDAVVPSATGLTAQAEEKEKVEKPEEKKPEEVKLGFCDQGDIKRVITGRTGAIKFCYERKLQLDQELKGNITVRLTIGADGSVQSASSSGSMPDKSVHECVVKALRSLKFKPPDGGLCVVNYPFVFQP